MISMEKTLVIHIFQLTLYTLIPGFVDSYPINISFLKKIDLRDRNNGQTF